MYFNRQQQLLSVSLMLLEEQEETPERDLKIIKKVKGHVVFKDVHFGYVEDVKKSLKDSMLKLNLVKKSRL
jgi:ABC-type bacteriocin/lantibiotic exporter with double-glycine peptidase domain